MALSEPSISSDEEASKVSLSEAVRRCREEKEAGAAALSNGDLPEAAARFEAGIGVAQGHAFASEHEGVPIGELRNACRLNLALVCAKQQRWREAADAAQAAHAEYAPLGARYTKQATKALFRRGVALGRAGELRGARAALEQLLKGEPGNADAQHELSWVAGQEAAEAARARAAFGGLFERGSLADGRAEQSARARQAAEDAARARWVAAMAARPAGTPEVTFADWRAEQEEKERKEREEKQRKYQYDPTGAERGERKAQEGTSGGAKAAAKRPTARSKASSASTTIELDEEDEAIVNETKKMGYCYFARDSKRMRQGGEGLAEAAPVAPAVAPAPAEGLSDWNAGKTTYEERNVTEQVKVRLQDAFCELPGVASVTLKGEAHTAIVRRSRRLIFEFEADLALRSPWQGTARFAELASVTDGAPATVVLTPAQPAAQRELEEAAHRICKTLCDEFV